MCHGTSDRFHAIIRIATCAGPVNGSDISLLHNVTTVLMVKGYSPACVNLNLSKIHTCGLRNVDDRYGQTLSGFVSQISINCLEKPQNSTSVSGSGGGGTSDVLPEPRVCLLLEKMLVFLSFLSAIVLLLIAYAISCLSYLLYTRC